jgi:predicted metalloprotease with PDZ domain
MKMAVVASAFAGLLVQTAMAVAAVRAPVLSISLTPGPMDEARNIGEVRIAVRVPDMIAAAGEPLFTLPAATHLKVSDDRGPLTVRAGGRDENSPGFDYVSSRAVSGDLLIRYEVIIRDTGDNGGTTPIFPRLDGRAFSAIGMTLFAIPQSRGPYRLAIHWHLSAMGPGAMGVSSLGDGDAEAPAGPVERLGRIVVMAGQLHHEPAVLRSGKFEAVWAGKPGFDPRPAMRWARKLHAWMVHFFDTPDDPAYRVFLRNNGGLNAGGGVAFPNSFFATWGPGVNGQSLRGILGHEMVHTFTENDLGRWYVEGDAVYYQVQLPWRAGMASTAQYLRDINLTAARYYTNLEIHAPEKEIDPNFFKDPWINTLDYDRGALYFAQLNAMIRKKSGGKRSIDDLMRIMVRKGRDGEKITNETWYALIRKDIGEDAVALTKSLLAGGVIVPDSDAYGPCFRRYVTKIRRYQLGFKVQRTLPGKPAVISDLIAGSNAAKAGLRGGDTVILPELTSEGPRRDPQETITATVIRGHRTLTVTWLPRGEAVKAYQWARVPGLPDSACRPSR